MKGPLCCEGEDRTPDLRVMSPTSYRCSTSRYGCKCTVTGWIIQNKNNKVPHLQDFIILLPKIEPKIFWTPNYFHWYSFW